MGELCLEKLSEDESLKRKIDSERRSCIVADFFSCWASKTYKSAASSFWM